jgi:hypothetical protein
LVGWFSTRSQCLLSFVIQPRAAQRLGVPSVTPRSLTPRSRCGHSISHPHTHTAHSLTQLTLYSLTNVASLRTPHSLTFTPQTSSLLKVSLNPPPHHPLFPPLHIGVSKQEREEIPNPPPALHRPLKLDAAPPACPDSLTRRRLVGALPHANPIDDIAQCIGSEQIAASSSSSSAAAALQPPLTQSEDLSSTNKRNNVEPERDLTGNSRALLKL